MASIVVGSNSYVTEAELDTYASDRAITISATDKTVILIKAMDYIETRKYKGTKTDSAQALEFPRIITDAEAGYDSAVVPDDIKNAQIVAALEIDAGNDLQPTIEKYVTKEKVDVIEVEYSEYGTYKNIYTALNDLLCDYLASGCAYSSTTVRT